jgi:hypothetical protein
VEILVEAEQAARAGDVLALLEAIAQRTELARRRLDELARTLEDATDAIERRQRATAPAARTPAAAPGGGLAERVSAVELAVAGLSRAEVAARLRAERGVADPEPALDDVFGPGTPPETRLPRR